MSKRINYEKELEEIIDLRKQGFKLNDIVEITGIPRGTVSCRLSRAKSRGLIDNVDGMEKNGKKSNDLEKTDKQVPQVIAKEKTLEDFNPRDLLKHLFSLGYRIDEKGIYVMVKQYVNLQSIIND